MSNSTKAFVMAANSLMKRILPFSERLDYQKNLSNRERTLLIKHLKETCVLLRERRNGPDSKISRTAFAHGIVLRNLAAGLLATAEEEGLAVSGSDWLTIRYYPDVIKYSSFEGVKGALSKFFQTSPRWLESLKDKNECNRFKKHQQSCLDAFEHFKLDEIREFLNNGIFRWSDWSSEIKNAFSAGIPIDFLRTSIIASTLFSWGNPYGYLKQVMFLETKHSKKNLRKMLREHYIGNPEIVGPEYLTSCNTALHCYHLERFVQASKKPLSSLNTVIEWGGGYGNLARIFKQIRPQSTYIIVDLPPLCSLQSAYLIGTLGEKRVNRVTSSLVGIQKGKVNLVPVHLVGNLLGKTPPDLFISNFALTETSPFGQKFVSDSAFFGARNVMVSFFGGVDMHRKNLPILSKMRTEQMSKDLSPERAAHYAFKT